MRIVYNRFIPFRSFKYINLFGVLFLRKGTEKPLQHELTHEKIHTRQIIEVSAVSLIILVAICLISPLSWWWVMLAVPSYYLVYLVAWACAGFSYQQNKMEKEAYSNQYYPEYPRQRNYFAWIDENF